LWLGREAEFTTFDDKAPRAVCTPRSERYPRKNVVSSADEVFRKLSMLSKDQSREEAYKIVQKSNPTAMKSVP
jgi:hypothetical protein